VTDRSGDYLPGAHRPGMDETLRVATVPTPIGSFRVVYRGRTLHVVDLVERGTEATGVPDGARPEGRGPGAGSPPAQLREYFRGQRRAFDVEIAPERGSAFDRAVWRELCRVPAGATVSYGELARRAGHPGAARAVGGAMHRNPIPIVVPCHRVVGDDASLTGYGLGLWRKRWLLQHEGAWPLKNRTVYGPKDPDQLTLDAAPPRRASGRAPLRARGAPGTAGSGGEAPAQPA
jgi:O-6-methylguanine DNA methyltransferase